jgi:flagellar biosynthesis GTPase FlhF
MGTETWQGVLATVATVVGIISGIAGVVFGVIQYRGKVAEGERANRAEQATERMAAELTAARAELARSSQAQERLADLEGIALTDAQEAARRERVAQRQRDAAQNTAERRQERERKAHDRKVLAETKKQTRTNENALKELKRQGRKK